MVRKSITLKAWEDNKQKALAVQGEVGARWLDITLLDEGIPLDLTNCFAVIYMDTGAVIYNTCEITDAINGQISVELTQNMSGIVGEFETEIHIYDELGNVLKVKGLTITIISSTDITVTVEARDEFTALQQSLATVGQYSGRIDTNVTDILTNAENIAENREDIDENRTDINTNTSNIQTLNTNKADKTETDRLEDEKAGILDITNGTITVNANTIQGVSISNIAPTENQVLKYVNGVWTPSKLITLTKKGIIRTTAEGSSSMSTSIVLPFVPLRIYIYGEVANATTPNTATYRKEVRMDIWDGIDFEQTIYSGEVIGQDVEGDVVHSFSAGTDKLILSLVSNVLTLTKFKDTCNTHDFIYRPEIDGITFNYEIMA